MEELKGGRDGGGAFGTEGRNYHISGCSGVPPFGTDTNTAESLQQPVGCFSCRQVLQY